MGSPELFYQITPLFSRVMFWSVGAEAEVSIACIVYSNWEGQ